MSFSTTVKETFGTRDSKLDPSQSLILKKKFKNKSQVKIILLFLRTPKSQEIFFSKTSFIKLKRKQIIEKSKR